MDWKRLPFVLELSLTLLHRNITSQYRKTFLGYAWVFLPSLATTLAALMLYSGGFVAGDPKIPYMAYAMTGSLLWQGFVEALSAPIRNLSRALPELSCVGFPRDALLLVGMGEGLFFLLARMLLLVLVFAWMGVWPPGTLPLGLLGLVSLVLLGWAVGLLLTPIGLLYQDVEMSLSFVNMLWFFATPVIFTIPESGAMRLVMAMNPVTHLVVALRNLLLTGETSGTLGFWLVTLLALAALPFEWAFVRRALTQVVKRIPS